MFLSVAPVTLIPNCTHMWLALSYPLRKTTSSGYDIDVELMS